jgi:hypothetical protein
MNTKQDYGDVADLMHLLEKRASEGDTVAAREYEKMLAARKIWGANPLPDTWNQIFLVAEAARERVFPVEGGGPNPEELECFRLDSILPPLCSTLSKPASIQIDSRSSTSV